MAIKTASQRAYLMGEGEMRKKIGNPLIIISKHGGTCPLCAPWEDRVLIDDVYSGGTAEDGDYPLLSEAMAAGLYHPRCRHGCGTYYPEVQDIWDEEAKGIPDQSEIEKRREQWKKRNNQSINSPDFDSMNYSELIDFAENKLLTNFEGLTGTDEDILRETIKVYYDFETKCGGNTISGLTVKFGSVKGNAFGTFDPSTNTITYRKKSDLSRIEEQLKNENLRYRTRWHKDMDWWSDDTYAGIIRHELGHAVDYETGYSMSKGLSSECVGVSGYAMTKPALGVPQYSEAWAENFSAYLSANNNSNRIIPEVSERIEQYFLSKRLKSPNNNAILDVTSDSKLFMYKSESFSTVFLPKQEYAHVMSEIATNLTEEQAKKKVFSKHIGDYIYTVENNGFGEYRVIDKIKIGE